jgi:hypothetical protein
VIQGILPHFFHGGFGSRVASGGGADYLLSQGALCIIIGCKLIRIQVAE